MATVVITPPEAPFVSIDDVKDHIRIDHSDDDAILQIYLDAAIAQLDGPQGLLGRALALQTLELRQDGFGDCGRIPLTCGPAIAVTAFTYDDADGVEQTLDEASYWLSGDVVSRAGGVTWPNYRRGPDSVRIRYTAGGTIPALAVGAALLIVGDLYANREGQLIAPSAASVINPTVKNLISTLRSMFV